MAFGPPVEKNANAGAPTLGLKVTPKDKFTYHLPGHTYLYYTCELLGCHPGCLHARLDGSKLPLPGDTARGGGLSRPKTPAKRGKKAAQGAGGVVAGDPDEILAEPTDARNRKVLAVGREAAYLSPDDNATIVCPEENLKAMFIEAAKCWPRTGLARASGAAVMVESLEGNDVIPFLNPETDKPLRFDSKVQVVEHVVSSRNPPPASVLVLLYKAKSSTGKRILTARTYLPAWRLKFRIGFDTSIFQDADMLEMFHLNVLAYAGGYIGLGAWRPNAPKAPGPFGRYQLIAFDSVK
jgi:hypothetical protein